MSDLDTELRSMLNSRAGRMTPATSPIRRLAALERATRRHRRRRTSAWVAAGTVVVAGVTGALATTKSVHQDTNDPASTTSPAPPTTVPTGKPSTPWAHTAPRCGTGQLTGRLPTGNGAGGTFYVNVILTNTSSRPCLLRGFAHVSFVQPSNGHQIGRSAERDTTYRPHSKPVILPARDGRAAIRIEISQAANTPPSKCQPVDGVGLRVVPPGNTTSLTAFPTYPLQACSLEQVHQLRVTQVLSMSDVD